MIYEIRTYTCRVGTVRKQLAFHKENGLPVQIRHQRKPVFIGVSEFGDVNQYVHVWQFDSLEHRGQSRQALMADPEWLDFLKKSETNGFLVSQHSQIVSAT